MRWSGCDRSRILSKRSTGPISVVHLSDLLRERVGGGMQYVPLYGSDVVAVGVVVLREWLKPNVQPVSLGTREVSWLIERDSTIWGSPENWDRAFPALKPWKIESTFDDWSGLCLDSLDWSVKELFRVVGRDCVGLGTTALPQLKNPASDHHFCTRRWSHQSVWRLP